MVLVVFFYSIFYLLGILFLTYILPTGITLFKTNEEPFPAVLTGRAGSAGTSGIGGRVGVWGWETTVDLSDTVRQPQETTRTFTRTI